VEKRLLLFIIKVRRSFFNAHFSTRFAQFFWQDPCNGRVGMCGTFSRRKKAGSSAEPAFF